MSQVHRRGEACSITYKPKVDALIAKYPELSAVRVLEEIRKGPDGYSGQITLVRDYLRQIRPARGRIYQEVLWEPGQALQVDWGSCGQIRIGGTRRNVSVLGSRSVLQPPLLPRVLSLATQGRVLPGHRACPAVLWRQPQENYFRQPQGGRAQWLRPAGLLASRILGVVRPLLPGSRFACARRDPESKGVVEAKVRYVKRNALQGRDEELTCWEDYWTSGYLLARRSGQRALHQTTKERPVDRFQQERGLLRPCRRPLSTRMKWSRWL